MRRSRVLPGLYLLVSSLPITIAYGERGIAERMLYWSAYICEEVAKSIDPTYEYTVAPGCSGIRAGHRCTLDEFLLHIWAEKKDANPPDTEEPTRMEVSTGIEEYPGLSFNQFEGRINNAVFNTGFKVDGNVNTAKLYPGATDYYDALSKMGRPIQALSQTVINAKTANRKFKITNEIKNPWILGKGCAAYVFALRRKDMDVYRAAYLRNHLSAPEGMSGGIDLEWVNIDTQKMTGDKMAVHESIPALDFGATIENYKNTVPNIEDLIRAQNTAFMNVQKTPGEYINKNHLKATEAARSAMTGCNCENKIPHELRKRRELANITTRTGELWKTDPAAVHWGGPKAAQSRKMRAQRLASMGVEIKAF
ncbi:hypothetical protein EDB80DRAFT_149379 [Ilyonectria destructans]|nr:hypothetical protein EDB80DRAFT_149379 [Ilyonectria destructans]